jgi:hypothetical protein
MDKKERSLAVFLHLAYMPAAIAIMMIAAMPQYWHVFASFTAMWLMLLVGSTLLEPKSDFMASHMREARRYHARAVVVCVVGFLAIFASGFVTFAAGFAFAPAFLAGMLLLFMLPTWRSAGRAYRGELTHYGLGESVAKGTYTNYFERTARV